jgi:hypothetical protein
MAAVAVGPNPTGMSIVRFVRREGAKLYVADMDILGRTPLLTSSLRSGFTAIRVPARDGTKRSEIRVADDGSQSGMEPASR